MLLMRTSLEKLRQKAAAEIKRKQQQRIIQQEEVCSSRSVPELLAGGIRRVLYVAATALKTATKLGRTRSLNRGLLTSVCYNYLRLDKDYFIF